MAWSGPGRFGTSDSRYDEEAALNDETDDRGYDASVMNLSTEGSEKENVCCIFVTSLNFLSCLFGGRGEREKKVND